MFCPQCGQQQAADEVRFCSRCGFQLGAVTGLLRSGGATPEKRFGGGAVDSPRRNGVRQGVLLMMIGVFLVPFFFVLFELLGTSDEMAMLGFLAIIAGFLRIVYAFFQDGAPARLPGGPPGGAEEYSGGLFARMTGRAPELPAARGLDARSYVPPRHDTADLAAPPPSVVEGPTRRFGGERDSSG